MLSPLVTAARASAPMAPARSRSSRSNPEPTIRSPSHSVGQAAEGPGGAVDDGHGVPLFGEGHGQPGADPAATDHHDVHPDSATRPATGCKERRPPRARGGSMAASGLGSTVGRWTRGIPKTEAARHRPARPGRAGRGSSRRSTPRRPPPDRAPSGQSSPPGARHRPLGRPAAPAAVPAPRRGLVAVPRDPPLPAEEQAARPAPGHRAAEHRAAQPAHRPRRAGARLHLVLGLRHRGDADPAGALRRAGRLRPGGADHHRHPRRAVLRHPVVPRGDPALHQGRRAPTWWPGTTSGPRWPRSRRWRC